MIATFTNHFSPWFGVSSNFLYIQEGGVNDIYSGSATASDTYSNLTVLWALARSKGWPVMAQTVSYNYLFSPTQEREWITLNSMIRASTNKFDYLYDLDLAIPRHPSPFSATIANSGFVHFNDFGESNIAYGVSQVISRGRYNTKATPPTSDRQGMTSTTGANGVANNICLQDSALPGIGFMTTGGTAFGNMGISNSVFYLTFCGTGSTPYPGSQFDIIRDTGTAVTFPKASTFTNTLAANGGFTFQLGNTNPAAGQYFVSDGSGGLRPTNITTSSGSSGPTVYGGGIGSGSGFGTGINMIISSFGGLGSQSYGSILNNASTAFKNAPFCRTGTATNLIAWFTFNTVLGTGTNLDIRIGTNGVICGTMKASITGDGSTTTFLVSDTTGSFPINSMTNLFFITVSNVTGSTTAVLNSGSIVFQVQ